MIKKDIITLKDLQAVIALFDAIAPDAALPKRYYEKTRYIKWSEFKDMQIYALDFEPYLTISQRCNMTYFGIHQSTRRLYLAHCNEAGHAPRWEARPVTLAQLMDVELMVNLHKNHAYNLGLNICFDLNYLL